MEWLRAVLDIADVEEGLRQASPVLAAQARALCESARPRRRDLRRAVLSVARYLLRAGHRPTPFGLFAGVTTAGFGERVQASWGGEPVAVVRAGAAWLSGVITRLQNCPELLSRLTVMANSTMTVRGGRLIVPYQPHPTGKGTGAVEVSLAYTAPVSTVLAATRTPACIGDVKDKLSADFPEAGPEHVNALLKELLERRALITCLHAPSTETDALLYLLEQLAAVDADRVQPVAELVESLREIHASLRRASTRPLGQARAERVSVAEKMSALVPGRKHPLAVDLRMTGAALTLPEDVAREAERAAFALARLSAAPFGTAEWKAHHMRFYERFGIGSMVPLQDVVADSGIGFPDGYPGTVPAERRPVSERDEALVRLAQAAVLDGRDEVVLDESVIADLAQGADPVRLPPHMELAVRVHADSAEGLEHGAFQLEVVSVSRGAGVGMGRFVDTLPEWERALITAELADLPTADSNTVAAQLSFSPLVAETAHVARAPQTLPHVISLDEYRPPSDAVLTAGDLAVGCDGRRMYLAVPAQGCRVEAVGMHALSLHTHTPPLARYLIELSRAQCATVTLFDWGAARTMPFLPRLRYGRTILAAARWRLDPAELPGRTEAWSAWDAAFTAWRTRRRLPARVCLTEGDRRLLLDLEHSGHRVLLRTHLNRGTPAVLTESLDETGWCQDRPHEIVIPLRATEPPAWPRLPAPTRARAIDRDRHDTPAASNVLLASLYGDIRRQDTILARHLPDLLDRLDGPSWWYVRFRDPDQHLRLRIALPEPDAFGTVAAEVSAWADDLHRAGLLRELRYPTSYPETGRWGSGPAWQAAENVFRADSRALLTQLRQPVRPSRRALVAAHTVAIASAFLGSTSTGMRWLIDNIPARAPEPVPRHELTEAVRLADPRQQWQALTAVPGGTAIVHAWRERDRALVAYREHLHGPHTQGIDLDDVLGPLLHVHFVRAVAVDFPEEAICLYLARAAAQAWTARTTGRNP
ncbi:lantibiotic dehydratase [Streptomyces sp. LHD-70]|uniref:lantibiotic dehydratase n=1 Tax=Streptomyces sp. LHD-70 TaxID=3072140 RepID=UPI00280CCE53|nr:lantibiotic dehydratase [Streptomyces sp. LHD-70]MDQ8706951.1 lantibiotic dehydratase [Streptomyces sp. LHD-70]